ncbi:2-oxoglutarate dehydrogenase E1 component [Myxococcaceae bacterium JPH2]|nr:2-oxoglutarate dehydrogenase E1 component [Myxococcaceae bacterium JPH2]
MGNPDSVLAGDQVGFLESMYAQYVADPQSVDGSWAGLFEQWGGGRSPVDTRPSDGAAGPTSTFAARISRTIDAFRRHGHLQAQVDPLRRRRARAPDVEALLWLEPDGFSPAELEQRVSPPEMRLDAPLPWSEVLGLLRRTYCGFVGVELSQLPDTPRRWLCERLENPANWSGGSREERRWRLARVSAAEAFEHVLHLKNSAARRFSLEGGESLIPMLDALLETAGGLGVQEVMLGMAHRGRLNVLVNVLGKPPEALFSEFHGPTEPERYLGRGDVKYHLGASTDHVTRAGQRIHVSLAFNPSHLEVVGPVVLGRARARQDRRADSGQDAVLPVIIHGDAAFAGQGVVGETFNMAALKGYTTGGTVHVVINNQVGFTTDPSDARSTDYCTAFARMLDAPIFHVNGDEPHACAFVMRLATEYRQRFHSDVVVDLCCYRRLGHNETDEPRFTQPREYRDIESRPRVRQLHAEVLALQGVVTAEEAEALRLEAVRHFSEAYERARAHNAYAPPTTLEGRWKDYRGGEDTATPEAQMGVAESTLRALMSRLATVPEGFRLLRQTTQVLERRKDVAEGRKATVSWAEAEHLALASLLSEGHRVRLTGQDAERGTFSHRHAVLHEAVTDARHVPLATLAPEAARFEVYNSPLSELAPMGFEFGYSLDAPEVLVLWEAQYGDFVNMAQPILDQFLASSEVKWRRLSGLTLLLPHGHEGGGPEHSSARLERFLELCADDNLQVCSPTTAAQLFHLLRRQVLRPLRKPLVIMTPKAPLRLRQVESPLEALARGTFQRVLADPSSPEPAQVDRLLLCSGKVFWDLEAERTARADSRTLVLRLEQLHPFPAAELARHLQALRGVTDVRWVQEEPENMGAWGFVRPRLCDALRASGLSVPDGPRYVGRPRSASPATGIAEAHTLEQARLVNAALERTHNRP